MKFYVGLNVGGKKTAVCVVDETGRIVWQRMVDTHPDMLGDCLKRWRGQLVHVGLESGPFTPHLHRSLAAMDFKMVCMDARRTADAIKSRRIKTDKGDAQALAEMLRTGWFTDVHVKTVDTHRLKALLGARDQLVKVKRSLGNQVRGLLRPFGIKFNPDGALTHLRRELRGSGMGHHGSSLSRVGASCNLGAVQNDNPIHLR